MIEKNLFLVFGLLAPFQEWLDCNHSRFEFENGLEKKRELERRDLASATARPGRIARRRLIRLRFNDRLFADFDYRQRHMITGCRGISQQPMEPKSVRLFHGRSGGQQL